MNEGLSIGQVAANLRSMEVYDWPHLTRAVLGRAGTRPEVVEALDDLLEGAEDTQALPAPEVLDADGVPIHAGDTVWDTRTGCRWTVEELGPFSIMKTEMRVKSCEAGRGHMFCDGSSVTHREPDSWERLEGDALKGVCEYAEAEVNELGVPDCKGCRFRDTDACEQEMALDIFERAKALAGVE